MAVNERLDGYDLTTPANNTPAGSTSIGSDLDDHLRDIKKNIGYAARWVHNPTVSAATTISSTNVHRVMPVISDTGDVTVTLGTPASAGDGNCVFVLKTVAANQVLVAGLVGGATKTLSISNQAILAICDGTSWFPMLGAGTMVAGGDVDISAAPSLSFSATAVDATSDKLLIHDDTDGTNKKINVAAVVGSVVAQATQAAIEAQTDEDTYVPPDLLKHHPGIPKAHGYFDGADPSGTVEGKNIASITDNGVGNYTINFTTNFSAATYAAIASVSSVLTENQGETTFACVDLAVGSFRLDVEQTPTTHVISQIEARIVGFACFGDQA